MRLRKDVLRFPEGKTKAFTLSYDDGVVQDRRLAAMFNQYGVKGTFNLNSGTFEQERERRGHGHRLPHGGERGGLRGADE